MTTRRRARALASFALAFAPAWYRARFADDIAADFDRLLDERFPRRWWLVSRAVIELVTSGLYESMATVVRAVGPVSHQPIRQTRLAALDRLGQDLRHAVRSARRVPLVTSLAVLSVALGSGATTAIYSAVDAVFFRPLPFPDPERIVVLPHVAVPLDGHRLSSFDLPSVASLGEVFSHVAAVASGAVNLGSGEEPKRVSACFVTSGFFDLLGHRTWRGRVFNAEEVRVRAQVVVLSSTLWRQHFAADPEILGTTVELNARQYRVIGVMPDGFGFPGGADLWLPLAVPVPVDLISEAFRNFVPSLVIARLAPGVEPQVARHQLAALRLTALPESQPPDTDLVVPLRRWLAGDDSPALVALLASALMALLVASANVATFLLAKAAASRNDIGIHVILGATRLRLVQRFLVEGIVIALLGALTGAVLAALGVAALETLIPLRFRGVAPLVLDHRVLVVSLGVSTVAVLACSLWPALSATRVAMPTRRTTPLSTASRRLVIAEVACAFVLTLLAGLFVSSLQTLLSTDVGFTTERIATARLTLPPARYAERAASVAFLDDTLARLTAMPGVEAAGAINSLPFAFEGGIILSVTPEEQADPPSTDARVGAPYVVVSPGYFDTLRIPLLEGRQFTPRDASGAQIAILNRTAARRLWADGRAVGRTIDYAGQSRTVVGIVDDVRLQFTGEVPAQVYLPMREQPQSYLAIVVRGAEGVSTGGLLGRIREAVHGIDPSLPLHGAMSMDDVIGLTAAPSRLRTLLVSSFAVLSVLLAIGGMYGVLADATTRRTREIGVRMALGASPGNIRRGVVAEALTLTAVGATVGLGMALAAERYLAGPLQDVAAIDPRAIVGALALFAAVALVASYVPGRRASTVNPVVALRHD